MKHLATLIPVLLTGQILFAQTSDTTRHRRPFSVGLEGMAGVSFGDKTVAFNVGGPHLKLKLGFSWSVALAAFPSLLIVDRKAEPRLGIGPRLDYRNLVLIVPAFFHNKTDRWIWTAGVGYKFH
ncbi:hypothetical protein [Chitinophaga caseinilytica]|uniref:hypothetical protein n=1 Tax=Chitinophaga caseinilytica TaxID=2267521 RepID=UPI003C2CB7AB